MPSPFTPISERTVMANMGVTEQDVERRKRFVGLVPQDLERIAAVRDVVASHADELAHTFFQYLAGFEEARVLLGYRELTEQAKALKRDHLIALAGGTYDVNYVEQRIKLALLYGRVGLEVKVFLGAFQHLLYNIGRTILAAAPSAAEGFESYMSLKKVAFLDIGVQVDVLMHERERTIRRQSEAIRELSTPVLQIRERMLLLPLIGVIDTHRAQLITDNLLKSIRANRAKVVVMDITGVATIDSKVANHLVQTVTAARLMGALVIVTGVSAEVAQSMVALGIDLAPFTTVGDLQGGVEDAERLLGYRVVHEPDHATLPEL
ncbi:MAG: protoglobin domain-containing protein [Acidobacteriota bacterium]